MQEQRIQNTGIITGPGIWRSGLKIVEDLDIVGFDDIPEATYFLPPLSTVRQFGRELGALAVD